MFLVVMSTSPEYEEEFVVGVKYWKILTVEPQVYRQFYLNNIGLKIARNKFFLFARDKLQIEREPKI